MAYESKIIIVDRRVNKNSKGEIIYLYGEKLADMMMGCMGYNNGWKELFQTPIDYTLYIENEDKATNNDKYGEHLKYTTISNVIEWLEKEIARGNDYRRLKPLLGLLKGFDEQEWTELQIIHYGY